MALNITFDGFCSRDNGSLSNLDIQYQGFFYKVNGGSSASAWNNVRTVEDTGYWNINLGDGDWLTQDGSAAAGDKVIIVFWRTGSNRNADCPTIDEWGVFEITLDGSSVYTSPTQVKKNIAPDLHWTFPTVGGTHYVNTYYSANNTSEDEHSWSWSGTTMYHWYSRYGQTINYVNRINNSVYDWDDSTTTTGLQAYDGSHQWSSPRTYNVELVVEDECGLTATGIEPITIYWHPPTCGITMNPLDPDPNTPVTFEFSGTDTDDTISYIEWTIHDDTNTTTSGARDDLIYHTAGTGTSWCGEAAVSGAFTDSGNHLVEITVHYNDGFDAQTLNCNDTFTQGLFTGPTMDFTQVPSLAVPGSGVKFVNASTNTDRVGLGLPDCDEYEWTWTEDSIPFVYSDKPYSYELEITSNSVDSKIKLCADWSDGFETHTTCIEKNIVFQTTVTVTPVDCYYNMNVIGTSSDGTISGYSWTVASGVGETGPWTDIWSSPTGIEQNDKKICFTSIGWYKATGFVYGTGTTTNDYEAIYVDEVCPVTTISGAIVAICEPDMYGSEWGRISRTGHEIKPTMRADVDIMPSARIINTYPLPKNL